MAYRTGILLTAALLFLSLMSAPGSAPAPGTARAEEHDSPSESPAEVERLGESDVIVVGGDPKQLLIGADGRTVFVSDFVNGQVLEVDLPSGLVKRRFDAPGGPVGLAVTDDGRYLFAAAYELGRIFRIDLTSGGRRTISGVADPWDLAIVEGSDGEALLAAAEHHGDSLAFFGIEDLDRRFTYSVPAFPYGLAEDEERRRLYVSSYGGASGGRVAAFDLDGMTRLWTTATGQGTFDLTFSATEDAVFATNYAAGNVAVLGPSGAVRDVFPTADGPRSALIRSGTVLVSLQARDAVGAYDAQTGEPLYVAPVGSRPSAMAWIPSGDHFPGGALLVANEGDGTLSVLREGSPAWTPFADVPPDHPFYEPIKALSLKGIVHGYTGSAGVPTFRPNDRLARAQAAKILVEALSLHTAEIEAASLSFADVTEAQLYPFDYVQEAARWGLIRGFSTTPATFGPYEPVSRVQLVRMLRRAAELRGNEVSRAGDAPSFADVPPSHPDYEYVVWAYRAGLIDGRVDETGLTWFSPHEPATRGQTSKILFNFLAGMG